MTRKRISLEEDSYRVVEEVAYSKSFPGLKTVYRINEVTCHLINDAVPSCLGLPEGAESTNSPELTSDLDLPGIFVPCRSILAPFYCVFAVVVVGLLP